MELNRANGCPWHAVTTFAAAKAGHFEMLKCAREHGCPWHEPAVSAAARSGNLQLLQWAVEQGCPLWGHASCREAAGVGHFDVLWIL